MFINDCQLTILLHTSSGDIKVLWKMCAGSNLTGSGSVQVAEAVLTFTAKALGDITQLECKVAATKGVALHLTPLTSKSISGRGGGAASSATMSVHLQVCLCVCFVLVCLCGVFAPLFVLFLQRQATGHLPRVRVHMKYFFEDRAHEFTMDAPAAFK